MRSSLLNLRLVRDLESRLGVGSLFAWIEKEASALAERGWQPLGDPGAGRVEFTRELLRARDIEAIKEDDTLGEACITWNGRAYIIHCRKGLVRLPARFAVAHEIGHTYWFRNGSQPLSPLQRSVHRDSTIEKLCDEFAAALLVPQGRLRARVEALRRKRGKSVLGLDLLGQLAAEYGVADQLVARRWLHGVQERSVAIVRIRRRASDRKWVTSWCATPGTIREPAEAAGFRIAAAANGRVLPDKWIPDVQRGIEEECALDGRWWRIAVPQPAQTARRPFVRWEGRERHRGFAFQPTHGDWMLVGLPLDGAAAREQ